eukprot:3551410-Prymnesium_polylepis.2
MHSLPTSTPPRCAPMSANPAPPARSYAYPEGVGCKVRPQHSLRGLTRYGSQVRCTGTLGAVKQLLSAPAALALCFTCGAKGEWAHPSPQNCARPEAAPAHSTHGGARHHQRRSVPPLLHPPPQQRHTR